ncbi:MAG: NUDIX domain-containing protein [Ruminococcus sp.]|nr:NUDIX domain-containing protein [Ruminococcus sp.]
MRYSYCPFCGEKTVPRRTGDEGDIPWCDKCSRPLFDSFSVCTLSVVVNEDKEIALIRQSYGDTSRFVGVAGYMKCGETAEESAAREIAEETGLEALSVSFLESHFYDGRDQLMLGFLARVRRAEFSISGELSEARWFTPEEAIKTVREGSIIQKLLIAAEKRLREI